jgi:hypothetical protein
MERLLQLHFKYPGITYRDVRDEAQAAEHVVGLTAAVALQPYKVRRPDQPHKHPARHIQPPSCALEALA